MDSSLWLAKFVATNGGSVAQHIKRPLLDRFYRKFDEGTAVAMRASAKPIEDVVFTLSEALDALDSHGQAMAALHLAMAVDCLRATLDSGGDESEMTERLRPQLRLVVSS
ncbi:MAG: hypothetical protein ACKOVA_19465 [Novosphingobium sp.]